MELEFVESLFVCGVMTILFLIGFGIVTLVVTLVAWFCDHRAIRNPKWYVSGRTIS